MNFIVYLVPVVALVIWGSGAWVYWDATAHKIGKIPGKGGFQNQNLSAGAWAFFTLLIWIAGFPFYLSKRRSLIESAKEQPVEVKRRGLKLAIILVLGSLYVLGQYADSVEKFGPKPSQAKAKPTTGQSAVARAPAAAVVAKAATAAPKPPVASTPQPPPERPADRGQPAPQTIPGPQSSEPPQVAQKALEPSGGRPLLAKPASYSPPAANLATAAKHSGSPSKKASPRRFQDARQCLDEHTDYEIARCAEKYL